MPIKITINVPICYHNTWGFIFLSSLDHLFFSLREMLRWNATGPKTKCHKVLRLSKRIATGFSCVIHTKNQSTMLISMSHSSDHVSWPTKIQHNIKHAQISIPTIQWNLLDYLYLSLYTQKKSMTRPFPFLSQPLVPSTNDQIIHQKFDHGNMFTIVKMAKGN